MAKSTERCAAATRWLSNTGPTARDMFEMLGVHKNSTVEEVTARRAAIAWMIHPDHFAKDDRRAKAASEYMARVNAAHSILTDKARKLRYMAELATGRSLCPTCQGAGFVAKQKGFKAKEISNCTVCGGSGLLKNR